MKKSLVLVGGALLRGLLVVIPIYLAVLLLLKGMKTVAGLVRPFALLLPDWFPAEKALSLVLVLLVCILIGLALRTHAGRVMREKLEKTLFERIPGYALLRSLTQQLAGESLGLLKSYERPCALLNEVEEPRDEGIERKAH